MSFDTLSAVSAEQVWDVLDAQVQPGPTRDVAVEQALGCVLASDASSAYDFPPFDRAVMDGYAVRSSDFSQGSARLRVVGLVRAGTSDQPQIAPGTCVRINTGAPVPAGADAVVVVEQSRDAGEGCVELTDTPTAGQYIDPRSAFIKRDDVLVPAGTRIDATTVAALAAGGATHVTVYSPPRVGLLSTGHELVPTGTPLAPGQIANTNVIALAPLIEQSGGQVTLRAHCPDDRGALRAVLERGLADDVLCITGGMSKGTHDLVPPALEELDVQWLIKGLHLKPGKPTRIGRSPNGCWVVGLPGNPISCAVCAFLFVRGLLARLQGLPHSKPPHLTGCSDANLPPNGDRPMYHPARWRSASDGRLELSPLAWRGSGDPFLMADASALIHRPELAPAAPRGATVRFVPLDLRM